VLWWQLARAGGITAWTLLALSMAAGVANATRVLGRRVPSSGLLAVHRTLGGLAVVFLGIHVLATVADTYVHFGLADVLVPLASGWRPVAVAWGVVAAWLLVAVEVTSLVRHRLPTSAWRWIHLSSYGLFTSSTIHLFAAGSDTYGLAIRTGVVVLTGVVALLSIAAALGASHGTSRGSADLAHRPPTASPYADVAR
jgi:hypothetical protein